MEKIKKKLETLTGYVLNNTDSESDIGKRYADEMGLLQDLWKAWKLWEKVGDGVSDTRVKRRLDVVTTAVVGLDKPDSETSAAYKIEIKTVVELIKTWAEFSGTEIKYDVSEESDEPRKSSREWDVPDSTGKKLAKGSLSTDIHLTSKQDYAFSYLDDETHDKLLLVGGSGSGKTFVAIYKIIRDALRYKAPCLVARDKMTDLTQGVIEQTVPAILQLIAEANGQKDWRTWTIDGLKFAKWTDKRSKLEFATGGYIRFGGLSIRDLSESGSDKILSPSWLHIEAEEVSELEWPIIEKLLTRLRYHVPGVLNKFIMTENPPSINHFTYKVFFEKKRIDGTPLSLEEIGQYGYVIMAPQDNAENLSENYLRNLSQMTGANYERFYLGKFQDMEAGDIFKKVNWTDDMPQNYEWERICLYTDPTPLTTRDHSVYADYKASVLVGLCQGITYLIELRLVRGSTWDMLSNIKQLWDVSPNQSITEVVMEKKQVPSDFKQVMEAFTIATGWMVPIVMDTRHFGDKKQSIELFLQPLFETETILFNVAFKDTERGKQAQYQILKFSRKVNKHIHDDVPDAIMKADTYMKNKSGRKRMRVEPYVALVTPGGIQNCT